MNIAQGRGLCADPSFPPDLQGRPGSADIPAMVSVRRLLRETAGIGKGIGKVLLVFYFPLVAALVLWHFPYDTDQSARSRATAPASSSAFYEVAYRLGSRPAQALDYEDTARKMAESAGVRPAVGDFVRRYSLGGKKVLEVGSGAGTLQDMVKDYTGLDLSAAAARHYHKPFVAASATDMPFPDHSFDAVWSIWVLEHIPDPERALREIRRVVKPGGVVMLAPAWLCPTWAAGGFEVRPYGDFDWRGKLLKATIPIRKSDPFATAYLYPTRAIRWLQYRLGGDRTPLHYRALTPNYDVYWQPDSDAAVSLDSFEVSSWFKSRGDECLNCGSQKNWFFEIAPSLVIRIGNRPEPAKALLRALPGRAVPPGAQGAIFESVPGSLK
jgi:SAM-dependent methyltransferase